MYRRYLRNRAFSLVKVRFSRPESEQARQRRIQSYEFLQKKQAEEPWVHLHYHGLKVGVTQISRPVSESEFKAREPNRLSSLFIIDYTLVTENTSF